MRSQRRAVAAFSSALWSSSRNNVWSAPSLCSSFLTSTLFSGSAARGRGRDAMGTRRPFFASSDDAIRRRRRRRRRREEEEGRGGRASFSRDENTSNDNTSKRVAHLGRVFEAGKRTFSSSTTRATTTMNNNNNTSKIRRMFFNPGTKPLQFAKGGKAVSYTHLTLPTN